MSNVCKEIKVPLRQQGVALVVALVFLLAMTAIGVSSFVNTTLQERMVNSGRQADLAAQAAIVAQRAAEQWLTTNLNGDLATIDVFSLDCQGFYQPFNVPVNETIEYVSNVLFDYPAFASGFNVYDDQAWRDANSRSVNGVLSAGSIARLPRYVIEFIGLDPFCNTGNCSLRSRVSQQGAVQPETDYWGQFRITAIGWGRDESIYRIIQSTIKTRLSDDGSIPTGACPAATTETG